MNRASDTSRARSSISTYVSGRVRREEEKRTAENVFEEIMSKNFPNFILKINLHFQKSQQI